MISRQNISINIPVEDKEGKEDKEDKEGKED